MVVSPLMGIPASKAADLYHKFQGHRGDMQATRQSLEKHKHTLESARRHLEDYRDEYRGSSSESLAQLIDTQTELNQAEQDAYEKSEKRTRTLDTFTPGTRQARQRSRSALDHATETLRERLRNHCVRVESRERIETIKSRNGENLKKKDRAAVYLPSEYHNYGSEYWEEKRIDPSQNWPLSPVHDYPGAEDGLNASGSEDPWVYHLVPSATWHSSPIQHDAIGHIIIEASANPEENVGLCREQNQPPRQSRSQHGHATAKSNPSPTALPRSTSEGPFPMPLPDTILQPPVPAPASVPAPTPCPLPEEIEAGSDPPRPPPRLIPVTPTFTPAPAPAPRPLSVGIEAGSDPPTMIIPQMAVNNRPRLELHPRECPILMLIGRVQGNRELGLRISSLLLYSYHVFSHLSGAVFTFFAIVVFFPSAGLCLHRYQFDGSWGRW